VARTGVPCPGHEPVTDTELGKKGTDVDDIELTDQTGQPWRVADALQRGAVVLVFYRGDW